MKIVITSKVDLGPKLATILHRLVGDKEGELTLFATPAITELLKKLLAKSNIITEINISDKTIYIAKSLRVQIETIDEIN